jgi:hypothetical protein
MFPPKYLNGTLPQARPQVFATTNCKMLQLCSHNFLSVAPVADSQRVFLDKL